MSKSLHKNLYCIEDLYLVFVFWEIFIAYGWLEEIVYTVCVYMNYQLHITSPSRVVS